MADIYLDYNASTSCVICSWRSSIEYPTYSATGTNNSSVQRGPNRKRNSIVIWHLCPWALARTIVNE